ncbi:hypothetical protein BAH_0768 [Bacillus anthracis str. A0442]|nr:hypothetical protein BAH_0768 [Bacillus anthracis str. A0442]EDT17385.1 hypothetical protein BAM_0748 [Bacillus anthracis str. A0465]EEM91335.1 hypothetical protein bthur0012_6500 [Bacillus thuringiensis serovar pulsiensis BGSC 4CC1]
MLSVKIRWGSESISFFSVDAFVLYSILVDREVNGYGL